MGTDQHGWNRQFLDFLYIIHLRENPCLSAVYARLIPLCDTVAYWDGSAFCIPATLRDTSFELR